MKPRRPARARRQDALSRVIQRLRLDRIAAGSLEPAGPRERYYLWTLQACGRVRAADFIVSGLLFMAETEERKLALEAAGEGAPSAS